MRAQESFGDTAQSCVKKEEMMADLAILVLRLGIGIMFSAHGLQKTFGMFGGPGIAGVTKMVAGMGFTPAAAWAYALAYTELID